MAFILDSQTLHYLLAGLGFFVLCPSVSFLIKRRVCNGQLDTDLSGIAFLAALVFAVAILCEATVNPVYEILYQHKLWEYRILPLHDQNVSVLGFIVWGAYGVHMYFLNQSLERYLPAGRRRMPLKAVIVGCEAPLLWEVLGNGYFLLTVGEFYAYYLPGDLWHFTSFQVVPIYIGGIYLGLVIYERLKRHAPQWRMSAVLMILGLVFLVAGK